MGKNKIHKSEKEKTFFEAIGDANENAYLALFALYVSIFFWIKIAWVSQAEKIVDTVKSGMLGIVMWGAAVYLFFVLVSWMNIWKNNLLLIITGLLILVATGIFTIVMSTNVYGVVMDVFFCLMAYRKDFRKILRCTLIVTIIMLLIAGLGLPIGYTMDMGKPDRVVPGHSLGINYPNTWGYLAFLGLLLLWYLYLRYKPVITFVAFWTVSIFMYKYITCQTIAIITIAFPALALIVDLAERHQDKKNEEGTFKRRKPLEWLLISIPFLSWAFMMINSMAVEWWHQYYHGALRTLAWRFIQGGLYFRTYGLPLVGNPYRANEYTYMNINGEFIQVGILDSSFAAYIIMRGILWLTYTLAWLCVAHWKALKKRDYAIIFIETVILGFAMMERPGLEMWYNFVMLYPLAKVVSKPGTEQVLEFDKRE